MTAKGPNHPNRPSSSTIVRGRLGRIVRGYLGACFIAAWGLPLGLIMGDVAAGHRIAGRLTDFGVVVGGFFVILLVAAAPFATATTMIVLASAGGAVCRKFPAISPAMMAVVEEMPCRLK